MSPLAGGRRASIPLACQAVLALLLGGGCVSSARPATAPARPGRVLTEDVSALGAPTLVVAEPLPSVTPVPEGEAEDPAGCAQPPDDYQHVQANGKTLNGRTLAMLRHAQEMYAGPIDLDGAAITQGSFSDNGPASFGTHLGGGVVDISVIRPGGTDVLYPEIESIIRALRVAGFAAWLRDWNELAPGSEIHIHAVAIGDRTLSPAALDQLTGKYGYFRGYTGVPTQDGVPVPDRHGGPVLCRWMLDLGYRDLREGKAYWPPDWPAPGWQDRLADVAATYVADTGEGTVTQARRLHFLTKSYEDPSNMCGPLAAAILKDAGLLPSAIGPVADLKSYWLANPRINNRPWWSLFSPRQYDVFKFSRPINQFDFGAWPLRPGDFVYTHAGSGEYDHMFVVTAVDEAGRAYTVTNQRQMDGSFRIEWLVLYDPTNPAAGVMRGRWVGSAALGRTGLGGFEVLRRKGISLPAGSRYPYVAEPGDTLALVASKFATTPAAILAENPALRRPQLVVGQPITVRVGAAP